MIRSRVPIMRMTLAFAAVMSLLFAAIGIGVDLTMAGALLDELDTGLRFRAVSVQHDIPGQLSSTGSPSVALVEPNEELTEIVAPDGTLLQSSRPRASTAVLPRAILAALTEPIAFERQIPDITGTVRLLAVPSTLGSTPVVIIVGASLQDRADALRLLTVLLAIAEPIALIVASGVGWIVAGSALRPVERMRQQAAAVSVSGLDRRLDVPSPDDEIARLARTLNAMLDRLHESFQTQHRFLDMASHELRTPLAALKAELDLALARPRTTEQTHAALVSASEEADRLAQLANDILALSRARQGRLPIHRTPTRIDSLIDAATGAARTRAGSLGVSVCSHVPQVTVLLDQLRVRQAVGNVLDNALRHSPPGGVVRLRVTVEGDTIRIAVDDDGPGFGAANRIGQLPVGAGLGLSIVRAIADGHGGTLSTDDRPAGGARVTITLRTESARADPPGPIP